MNLKLRRTLGLVCVGSIIAGSMTVNAAQLSKTAKLVYNNIKVKVDGQYQQPNMEPFFIGDSVYVSLRDAGQLTNNTVQWNNQSQTVEIMTSRPPISTSDQEVAQKNFEIAALKSEVAQLKQQIERLNAIQGSGSSSSGSSSSSSSRDLDDAMKKVRRDYDTKHNVDWTFKTSENSKSITLDIQYDSYRDRSDFDRLSESTLRNFVRDILDDVQKEYEGKEINGEIYDTDRRETKATYTMSAKGSLTFSMKKNTSTSDYNVSKIQDKILEDFKNVPKIDFGKNLEDLRILVKNVKVDHNSKFTDIEVRLESDFESFFSDAWNNISKGSNTDKLERHLKDISKEVKKMVDDADNVDVLLYSKDDSLMAAYEDGSFRIYSIR